VAFLLNLLPGMDLDKLDHRIRISIADGVVSPHKSHFPLQWGL